MMVKKDLSAIGNLANLAANMPTQRPVATVAEPPLKVAPKAGRHEPVIQFSLSLRKSLRQQLARLAAENDMTMRAFVLGALKEKGLSVRDDDLTDMRKERQ
jgi:hypothetical protein